MSEQFDNPMGLDGFEFVEFASPEPGVLESVFHLLGFDAVARHRSKNVTLWRQGDINFIICNEEPRQSRVSYFAQRTRPLCLRHGVSGFRDATLRLQHVPWNWARSRSIFQTGPMELRLPAIKRHRRRATVYLIDRYDGWHLVLRHRFRTSIDGVDRHPGGLRLRGYRPPDAQRLPRPYGVLGRLLRKAVQLSGDIAISTSRASTQACSRKPWPRRTARFVFR